MDLKSFMNKIFGISSLIGLFTIGKTDLSDPVVMDVVVLDNGKIAECAKGTICTGDISLFAGPSLKLCVDSFSSESGNTIFLKGLYARGRLLQCGENVIIGEASAHVNSLFKDDKFIKSVSLGIFTGVPQCHDCQGFNGNTTSGIIGIIGSWESISNKLVDVINDCNEGGDNIKHGKNLDKVKINVLAGVDFAQCCLTSGWIYEVMLQIGGVMSRIKTSDKILNATQGYTQNRPEDNINKFTFTGRGSVVLGKKFDNGIGVGVIFSIQKDAATIKDVILKTDSYFDVSIFLQYYM